jgi:predicted HAD superfamily Cof-like phosphohydrolase
MSNFTDVVAFQKKFGIPMSEVPTLIDTPTMAFRLNFIMEEFLETRAGAFEHADLEKIADGLVDMVYVIMGTAAIMGIPWESVWSEVHAANMRKVRVPAGELGRSTRGHPFDVIKPEGWTPPNVRFVLDRYREIVESAPDYESPSMDCTLGDPEE